MTLNGLMTHFPNKYVCVHNTILDSRSLIKEADILCVFDTLDIATENTHRIRSYMKQYPDFDIIYCNYQDYVSTRERPAIPTYFKKSNINKHYTHPTEDWDFDGIFIGTQDEIDSLLNALE